MPSPLPDSRDAQQDGSNPPSRSSSRSSAHSSPPLVLRTPPVTYTDDELDHLEAQNEKLVTQEHLIHALDHVVSVLTARGILYGAMGGVSMILLGNHARTTSDVDIAVDAKVSHLLAAFADDSRVYLPRPLAVAGSGVARIFVLTGPAYNEPVVPLAVEADLILSGNKGAPSPLQGTTTPYTTLTPAGPRTYNLLQLRHLFLAKLRAYYQREGPNDFRDLVWMCLVHGEKVREWAGELDEGLRRFFVEGYGEEEDDEGKVELVRGVVGLGERWGGEGVS